MKVCTALIAVSLLFESMFAIACGTRLPAEQSKINAEQLAELKNLARAAARDADAIFLGAVTELTRPALVSSDSGTARFTVHQTLKGEPLLIRTAQWKERFIYSCQPSEMFHNVGFRPNGEYIIYLRDGEVVRSAAADHLHSGLLTLYEEQEIVISALANSSASQEMPQVAEYGNVADQLIFKPSTLTDTDKGTKLVMALEAPLKASNNLIRDLNTAWLQEAGKQCPKGHDGKPDILQPDGCDICIDPETQQRAICADTEVDGVYGTFSCK